MKLNSLRPRAWIIAAITWFACRREGQELGNKTLPHSLSSQGPSRCGWPAQTPWVLSSDSLGPLPLKSTIESIRAHCANTIESGMPLTSHAELSITGFNPPLQVLPLMPLGPGDTQAGGQVMRFVIMDPSVMTAEGIGVRSTIGQIRRAYGAIVVVNTMDEGYEVAVISRPGLSFTFYGQFDEGFLGGWGENMLARRPEELPDTLRVERLNAWSVNR